jgi:lysophospholipase L1-like esterase
VRETAVRLGLVAGGLLVALLLLELGLRVAAAVAPALVLRSAAVRDDGRLRIACIGDSHVYGAFVPAGAAFPEQLDRVLQRRGIPADVYNFGVPGQNSFQVRRRLPRILERVHPHVVVVLVGHNNYWNLSEREIDAPEVAPAWTWRDLRLARMLHVLRVSLREGAAAARRPDLRMIQQTDQGEQLLLDLGDGMEPVDMWRGRGELAPADVERVTGDDLRAIVAGIREAGAIAVLLDYPAVLREERAATQRAIIATATETGVLCLDTEALTRRLHRRALPDLFFPDLHPTARYYRAMAWTIARQLERRGIVAHGAATPGHPEPPPPGCVPLA